MPEDEPVINAVGLSCDPILISKGGVPKSSRQKRQFFDRIAGGCLDGFDPNVQQLITI